MLAKRSAHPSYRRTVDVIKSDPVWARVALEHYLLMAQPDDLSLHSGLAASPMRGELSSINIRSSTVWKGYLPYVRNFNICKTDDVFSKDAAATPGARLTRRTTSEPDRGCIGTPPALVGRARCRSPAAHPFR